MRRIGVIAVALCLLIVAGVLAEASGATRPPQSQLTFVAMPAAVPMPGYLQPYHDPTFGTQITRIADQAAMDSQLPVLAHHYAKAQPWNADGSLIALSGWPAAILDGQSYEFLRWVMPPGEHWTWTNTDPTTIYGVQQPRTLVRTNAITGVTTTIRDFGEYDQVSYGSYEGNLSNDDRYMALQCKTAQTNYVLVYDLPADSVIARLDIGQIWPNNVAMSQSGDYMAVQWDIAGDGERQGIDIFTNTLQWVRKVGTCKGCHYDLGYDTEGREVAVMTDIDGSSRAVVSVRFNDGARIELLRDDQMSWYMHVSCRNLDRPGWAYLTEFANEHTQKDKPNYQLAFGVRIDGSGTVEPFGHVHHSATAAYARSPFGVPNRDGTKMMFRSDWEDGTGPVYSYVAEMPPRRQMPPGSTSHD